MRPADPLRRRLQLVRQESNGECALACMAMIGRYHGHALELGTLRNTFPTTRQGLSLAAVSTVADQLGFRVRGFAVDKLDDLQRIATPAILHWDENHFVVLKSVRGGKFRIADPASGEWTYDAAELAQHFTGRLLELSPKDNFKRIVSSKKYTLRTILGLTSGLKLTLWQVGVLTLLTSLLTLSLPTFVQVALDSVVPKADFSLLAILAFGILFVHCIIGFAEWLQKRVVLNAGSSFFAQLTFNAVGHLFDLPIRHFEARHPGEIGVKLDSIEHIKTVVIKTVVNAFVDLMMIVLCAAFMFAYIPSLAAIVTLLFALIVAVRLATFPQLRLFGGLAIRAKSEERSRLIDNIRSIAPIKMANASTHATARWYSSLVNSVNATFRVGILDGNATLLVELITAVGTAVTLYYGVAAVIGQKVTVGMLYAFFTYRGIFFDKIDQMISHTNEIAMLSVNMRQLGDFLESEREVTGVDVHRQLRGNIQLDHAEFKAGFADRPILRGVNLTIPAKSGSVIGIVGASGAGKTTLLKLLAGLYVPTAGKHLVEGVELTAWGLSAYRENVALLLGSDKLSRGSIDEIVSSFDPAPDPDRLRCALLTACLAGDVQSLPQKGRTVVSEESGVLSSGQRRRLMLARALYRNATVLLLDEVTSNLDAQTSAELLNNLRDLPATKVIASHDPEVLRACDQLFHIEGGQLRPATHHEYLQAEVA